MVISTKIVFFIPPGVHMLDLSGPVQAFLAASQMTPQYGDRVLLLPGGSPWTLQAFISAACRIIVRCTSKKGDFLFIPGFSSSRLDQLQQGPWKDLYAWIRRQALLDIRVCSVCTGSFVLAGTGLLDGKKCTTHWSLIRELKEYCPAARVQDDALFTKDGGIYTSSAGISSGIDLALFILEEIHGALFAHKVARELVVYSRRSAAHSQDSIYLDYRNHPHNGIHQLQDWLIDHLETRATLEKMAEMVNMSSRNLTRTFKAATGISIHQYITLLRLEKAGNLRNSPGITVSAIAGQCGFRNERQLQRIWQRSVR